MPNARNLTHTMTPGTEWIDEDLRIWVVDARGTAVKTDRFAPNPEAIATARARIRERERELENWHENIALYVDSTTKMQDAAAQWRARAEALAPRMEKPSERWAWGVGGLVLGYLAVTLLSPPDKTAQPRDAQAGGR